MEGYPKKEDGCALLYIDGDNEVYWKSLSCNTVEEGFNLILCQGHACDASTTSCCLDCNICENYKQCGVYSKKQRTKKSKKYGHVKTGLRKFKL